MPLSVVSVKYAFIGIVIAKNASSTLRRELRRADKEAYEVGYRSIDESMRAQYFTFAILRDPVSRLLSAYQEISWRHEIGARGYSGRAFYEMDDTMDRFSAFLDEAEREKWDNHVRDQGWFLAEVRVDFLGCVSRLRDDLQLVYQRLGMGNCPELPKRRSRQGRRTDHNYDKFFIDESMLDAQTRARILRLYAADAEHHRRVLAGAEQG